MSDLRPSLTDGSNRESEDRKPAQAPRQTPGKWPLIALGVAVVAAVAIGGWYYLSTQGTVSTDDAYL
jgi:multidrug resistance efflux pump